MPGARTRPSTGAAAARDSAGGVGSRRAQGLTNSSAAAGAAATATNSASTGAARGGAEHVARPRAVPAQGGADAAGDDEDRNNMSRGNSSGNSSGSSSGSSGNSSEVDSDPPRPPPIRAVPRAKAAPVSSGASQTRAKGKGQGKAKDDTDSASELSDVDSEPPRPPPIRAVPRVVAKGAASRAPKARSSDDSDSAAESDPPRPPPIRAVPRVRAAAAGPAVSAEEPHIATTGKPAADIKASSSAQARPRRNAARQAAGRTAPAGSRTRPLNNSAKRGAAASDDDDSHAAADSSSDDDDEEDVFDASSESDESVDSDNLDDFEPQAKGKRKAASRTRQPTVKRSKTATGGKGKATAKGKGKGKTDAIEVSDDEDDEVELEEGQKIVGRIHPAPKSGWVPEGQISQNTLNFLEALMWPSQNDRDWFKSHEPWFRRVEQEWRAFADVLQVKMAEKDHQLPVLPARDVCHRIYRDVRFSPDKSPYKTNFGLTTSRSGRKGIWAGYHLYLCPGETFVVCGIWQPERDVLARIRARFLSPGGLAPLRAVIGSREFERVFGPARPHPQGKRQNIFGHQDALKVAPKGVDKTHKDIDFLKLRSMTVRKGFTDDEVLAPDFADKVAAVVGVMTPFIHTINDYIAPQHHQVPDSDDSGIEVIDP